MTLSVTEEFLRNYECSICLEPLVEAVALEPCQHVFNQKCVELIFNSQEINCPECRHSVIDIIPDIEKRELIRSKLLVIAADQSEDEATRKTVIESLNHFKIALPSDISIEIPPVFIHGRKPKRSAARTACIVSISAILIIGGVGLLIYGSKNPDEKMQIAIMMSGGCITVIGSLILLAAKKED